MEGMLVLPWWYGLDNFAHLRLPVSVFLAVWLGGWMLPRLALAGWRTDLPGPRRLALTVVEWVTPAALLWLLRLQLTRPLTPGEFGYAIVSTGLLLGAWRLGISRAAAAGIHPVSEGLRRLAVIGGSLWPVWGYMTRLLVGGTDAKWYAYMQSDFTTQSRAGVFPVFLGQSEWAWSGPIHPFRSAPLFLWTGGILDWSTAQALAPFSLQHVVVLTATLAGAFGIYATSVSLAPDRRWAAVALAVIYASCPGLVQTISSADAYMTYMAIAVLPLVLYGNLRTLTTPAGAAGYLALAAGLSLVWMAHPPVAYQASFATLVLQAGILLFGPDVRARLRHMATGAAAWLAFSVYYFYGMSEVGVHRPVFRDAVFVLGIAAAFRGVRALATRKILPAFILLPISGLGLRWVQPAWGWWWVAFVPLGTALAWTVRRWRSPERQDHGFEGIWLAFLAATVPAAWVLGPALPGHDIPAYNLMQEYGRQWRGFLAPLSTGATQATDWQPGLSLMALGALGVFAASWRGSIAAKLVAAAATVACLGLIRVPVVSDFLVSYALEGLLQLGSIPLTLRTLPVIACLLTGAAIMAVVTLRTHRAGLVFGIILGAASLWSLIEARQLVARQRQQTLPPRYSEWALHRENAVHYRFAYDLLPAPAYLSEGKIDERLEQRLLDTTRRVKFGPDDVARLAEAAGSERLELTGGPAPEAPEAWLRFDQAITIPAGGRVLMRFEFEPGIYSGLLTMHGNLGSYREYILPASGGPLAFGTAPTASKVISLWNTDIAPETYRLTFRRAPEHTVAIAGGRFATITLSRPEAVSPPVRIESWLPYRARVRLDEHGYLESSRSFFPGYKAWVDGARAPIASSPQNLLMVPVPPGEHIVEIRFVGTTPLLVCAVVSGVAWVGLVAGLALRLTHGGRHRLERFKANVGQWIKQLAETWWRRPEIATEAVRAWQWTGTIVVTLAAALRLGLALLPWQEPWWGAATGPVLASAAGSILLLLATWRLVATMAGSERTACLGAMLFSLGGEFLYYARLPLPFDWSWALAVGAMLAAATTRTRLAALGAGTLAAVAAAIHDGYAWAAAVCVVTGVVIGILRDERRAGQSGRIWVALGPVALVMGLQLAAILPASPWNPEKFPGWDWTVHRRFVERSEGPLALVWLGAATLAVVRTAGGRPPRWLLTWLAAAAVLVIGMILLARFQPILAAHGDTIRPFIWFVVILAAAGLEALWSLGSPGRLAVLGLLALAVSLATPNFQNLLGAITEADFQRRAEARITELRALGTSGTFRIERQGRSPEVVGQYVLLEAELVVPEPPAWQRLRLVPAVPAEHNALGQTPAHLAAPWPGAVRFKVFLPERTNAGEPLITTGETGRGDFLYLLHAADGTVRLGFDHWGTPGLISEPLAVDPKQPITIEASLGSLYPADAPTENLRRLVVRVNGRIVWSQPAAFYPAAFGTIRFGTNPIGGSTARQLFSGEIQAIEVLNVDESEALLRAR